MANKKMLGEVKGQAPPLLPLSAYRYAPYFGKKDGFHNALKAYRPGPSARKPLLLGGEEDAINNGYLVPPSSVLRLAVERGDFPHINVEFESTGTAPPGWLSWSDHILDTKEYYDTLKKIGLLRMIDCCRDIKINKHASTLSTLLSRWSRETHTFITAWGEFTITLEDIIQLTGVDVIGEVGLSNKFTEEEKQITAQLRRWYTECGKYSCGARKPKTGKTNYTAWQRYIFQDIVSDGKNSTGEAQSKVIPGPGLNDSAHLAGFLTMFLGLFLLPGKPSDSPNRQLFPLAARLAGGARVPLAPLILGNLYRWLDQAHEDHIRSMGRYDSSNFAPLIYLMGFVLERFPNFAPSNPVTFPGAKEEGLWMLVCRWGSRCVGESLANYIDNEREFCFRPYRPTHGVFSYSLFTRDQTTVTFPKNVSFNDLKNSRVRAVLCMRSCLLPTVLEMTEGVTAYNPHRVMRQFGYDLGVPGPSVDGSGDIFDQCLEAWKNFTYERVVGHIREKGAITIPSQDRVGLPTAKWFEHWGREVQIFKDFPYEVPVRPEPSFVAEKDVSLRRARELRKKQGWNGSISCLFAKNKGPVTNKEPTRIICKTSQKHDIVQRGSLYEDREAVNEYVTNEVASPPLSGPKDDIGTVGLETIVDGNDGFGSGYGTPLSKRCPPLEPVAVSKKRPRVTIKLHSPLETSDSLAVEVVPGGPFLEELSDDDESVSLSRRHPIAELVPPLSPGETTEEEEDDDKVDAEDGGGEDSDHSVESHRLPRENEVIVVSRSSGGSKVCIPHVTSTSKTNPSDLSGPTVHHMTTSLDLSRHATGSSTTHPLDTALADPLLRPSEGLTCQPQDTTQADWMARPERVTGYTGMDSSTSLVASDTLKGVVSPPWRVTPTGPHIISGSTSRLDSDTQRGVAALPQMMTPMRPLPQMMTPMIPLPQMMTPMRSQPQMTTPMRSQPQIIGGSTSQLDSDTLRGVASLPQRMTPMGPHIIGDSTNRVDSNTLRGVATPPWRTTPGSRSCYISRLDSDTLREAAANFSWISTPMGILSGSALRGVAGTPRRGTPTGPHIISGSTSQVELGISRGVDIPSSGNTPVGSSTAAADVITSPASKLDIFMEDVVVEPRDRDIITFYYRLHPEMLKDMVPTVSKWARGHAVSSLGQGLHEYRHMRIKELTSSSFQEFVNFAADMKRSNNIDLSWMIRRLSIFMNYLSSPELRSYQEFDQRATQLTLALKEAEAKMVALQADIARAETERAKAYDSAVTAYDVETIGMLFREIGDEEGIRSSPSEGGGVGAYNHA